MQPGASAYRRNLALVHHSGFGFHAEACGPGILNVLAPVLEHKGLVLEIGCGTGLLTRTLVQAGHRVVATDASPDMLDIAREYAPGAENVRQLVLPDDPLPEVDAVVGVGHALNYLSDEAAVARGLVAMARALCPNGILAVDICDLEYASLRVDSPNLGRVGDDWAIVTRFSVPAPGRFVRDITTFVPDDNGRWLRDDERHVNVMVDTAAIPALLAAEGVHATLAPAFGTEHLPAGLRALIGHKPVSGTWQGSRSFHQKVR